jgi:(p)ppGpp synthase/HD superfamily hydrolase
VFDAGKFVPVDLVERAREFAAEAYGSRGELEHPIEVAGLVRDAGFGEETQAAAVLHDLLEDTDVDAASIEAEFGSNVARLVSSMTEDESIEDYVARKDEHRRRVAAAGRDAAAIFVADKISNARRMRRGQKELEAHKVAHYAATLDQMRQEYPDLPLLDQLDEELTALRALSARVRRA